MGSETEEKLPSESESNETNTQTEAVDAIFQSLINEAINMPGDHGIQHKDIANDWESEKIIKQGKDFFHRNYFACAWTIIITELIQYPIQRITGFVLRNESYNGPQYAYYRGVVTFMHILKWFEGDISNKTADSSQDVYKVRKMHENALARLRNVPSPPPNKPKNERLPILEAIRADMAGVPDPVYLPLIMTSTPSVPMSQFDMVLVHGVFFFLLDVSPKKVGLHHNHGYESYIHYLAIIGKYLGIQDRFNLPLLDPAVRRLVSKRIWVEIMTPCFKNFNEKEFINLSYFAENGFFLNPFGLAVHVLVKDMLSIQPAGNTKRHVGFLYGIAHRFTPLMLFLVKYRPFMFCANLSMRFWLWVGIVSTRSRRAGNSQAEKTSKCMA